MGGDEVYGQDPRLCGLLEQRGVDYVLAIAGNRRVNPDGTDSSAADIAVGVADRHWHRYRAGHGAIGSRWYAWVWVHRRNHRRGIPGAADPPPQPDHR
ncbi:hypothetical protein ACIBO2_09035 [Nonomuraea sp. NPDC050022]|uniref:hypothetical protein n=1 Tax=unclassified Nonomuraea TaxID=2593643 RepID=UPI0033C3D8A6